MTKSVWQSGSVWLIQWFHGTFQVYFCLCVIKITFWMKLYLLWSPNVQSFDYFLTLTRQHYPCNQMVAGMQNPTFLHFDCYQMDIREHKYLHCENIRQVLTMQRNIHESKCISWPWIWILSDMTRIQKTVPTSPFLFVHFIFKSTSKPIGLIIVTRKKCNE